VLPRGRLKDPAGVARFEREMKAIGRLEHPHVIRAHDAGEADGVHFLVMEYLDGADLSRVMDHVGPLSVADACELVRQAALGLEYAHQQGLVHRDVKPSNLMLTTAGQVKVLGLGLARLSDRDVPAGAELTSTGQLMGTFDYMAPEQGSDTHKVDIRADVYSLGATLYKLLCGEAPFGGELFNTPMKKMLALATKEPLVGANITDAGLARLAGMKKLKTLQLGNNDITDKGAQFLAALPRLQNLDLQSTSISDRGLDQILLLPELTLLSLARTRITDVGVDALSAKAQLERLSLEGLPVSDDALDFLESLKKLRWLSLRDTDVTAEGVARLQKALPDCTIDWAK
jgi:serine/threonine protein kinase